MATNVPKPRNTTRSPAASRAAISSTTTPTACEAYLLAAFCFGYAALKVKGHVDNPQRGGLTVPVVVFIIAIVLAAGPTLLERAVESFQLDQDQQLQRPKF